jgi:hypothetical protein
MPREFLWIRKGQTEVVKKTWQEGKEDNEIEKRFLLSFRLFIPRISLRVFPLPFVFRCFSLSNTFCLSFASVFVILLEVHRWLSFFLLSCCSSNPFFISRLLFLLPSCTRYFLLNSFPFRSLLSFFHLLISRARLKTFCALKKRGKSDDSNKRR